MDAVERLARAFAGFHFGNIENVWEIYEDRAKNLLTKIQAPQRELIEKWRLAARIADNLAVQGKNWEERYDYLTEKAEELRKRAAELERTLEGRSDDR